MSGPLEKTTLRLNVSCSSRDKKFLVLGEKDSTICGFITTVQKMFSKLYPQELSLCASAVQNHNGFDISTDYKLGDIFEDNACVTIMESVSQCTKADESLGSSGFVEEHPEKSDVIDLKVPSKELQDTDTTLSKQQKPGSEKNNDKKKEKPENCLSPNSENKRSHSDSTTDDHDKRKKKYKNTKKKKLKQLQV